VRWSEQVSSINLLKEGARGGGAEWGGAAWGCGGVYVGKKSPGMLGGATSQF